MTSTNNASLTSTIVACLTLLGVAVLANDAQAQDTFYYRNGKKVPLKVDSTKNYVLLSAETQRSALEQSTKSTNTVLRRFESVKPLTSLNLVKEAAAKSLNWAIVTDIQPESRALEADEMADDIVYKAPFFITQNGKEVGMSHLVFVKLKQMADRPKLEELARQHKVEMLGSNKFMPLWFTLSCSRESTGDSLEVANRLFESGQFAVAEPDFLADFNIKCVNDNHFGEQWGMKNTGQGSGTAGVDIGICEAWSISAGDRGVVVAVLDHGIELSHPDMPNISSNSYDTVTGTSPSTVRGNHGTACAGIVGAACNNGGLGVAGVAPDTTLMSISDSLTLGPNSQQNLANGLSWAWQNGAHVISNSWGHDLLASALIDDAINNALTQGRGGKGCVVAFAAGNENGPIIYPANSNPEILVVGAMSPCGERKSPSSCDPEPFWGGCFGSQLDIAAPGVLIPTTDRQGVAGYDSGDYAMTFNGTSSATPHVAGVAALILAVAPDLTQQEVAAIIETNARKVGPYSYQTTSGRPHGTWHQEMGHGLVDAKACVAAAGSAGGGPEQFAAHPTPAPSLELPAGEGKEGFVTPEGKEGFVAPEGYLQSLPQGPELAPVPPEDSVARAAGFLWYNNVGVNLNTRLLGTSGTTRISVYARDIRWRYAFGNAPDVTSPRGDGGTAGSGWRFRNAHRFGVTIYQGDNYWNVNATSSGSPTVITGVSNTQPVIVTINDTNGNYSDNSGAFDLYIRKDN